MMTYSEGERQRGMRVMIAEGLFSRAMEGVTGGVILAGFALALGATDFEIGLIASIPFLAQVSHVFSVAWLARFPDRKLPALAGAIGGRALFLLIALLPFVDLPLRPVHALVPLLITYATLATFAGGAWQVWVRELVPRERIGRFFGRRMMLLAAVNLVVVLSAGQFIERWPGDPLVGFSLLFGLGGLLGLTSAAILSRAPSRTSTRRPYESVPEMLRMPFHDRNYRKVLIFLGTWGFAANIAVPFLSIVLLKRLGYGVGVVTIFAAISQLANVFGTRLWGPLTDRFGNKPILGLSGSVFLVGMTLWTLTPKDVPGTGVLIAAGFTHAFLGFALSGLDVASTGLVMKLAKEDEAPAYLASASVVKALAAGVAPLLGGIAATFLATRSFSMRFGWSSPDSELGVTAIRFTGHDFLFAASVVLCLYALHRLLAFEEEGEAPPQRVVRAMRREVGNVGSVAGLRQFAHAASYVVEAAYRFERSLDVRRALRDDENDRPPPRRGPAPPPR